MILQPIYNTTEIAHKDLQLKVTNQPESLQPSALQMVFVQNVALC
jgi:hypothetical protein